MIKHFLKYTFLCGIIFCLTSCGKSDFVSNGVLVQQAKTEAQKGNWAEARKLAKKAVDQNGKDANARVMLALALEQCEQDDLALEEIEQAVLADPNHFMAQYSKGRMLFKKQRYGDCPEPLAKANQLKPNMPQTLLLLARTNAILDVHKEAVTYYVALAKLDEYKNKTEPYNELGVLFMKKKDFKRALRFFREAYAKNDKSIPVNINLAVFWDNLTQLCGDDKAKARKPAANAIKYYIASEKLLVSNPQSTAKRKIILARIKELQTIK